MIINVDTLEKLRYIVENDKRVIVLQFSARWCTPCTLLKPQLVQMEKFYNNKILVIDVDVERYPNIADAFNITSIPTIMYFFHKKLWSYLTVTGADLGTIYQNVAILLTEHNDGQTVINRSLEKQPKLELDSINYNDRVNW